ncbi:MAG: energy transducer TonB [Cetobacterium sp.]
MKRENNDFKILIISVVINFLILFLIPGITIDKIVNKKLKVGLVSTESPKKVKQTPKVTQEKNNSSKKEPKKEVKKELVKEVVKETKPVEKVAEVKKLSLDDLAKNITKRETEFLVIDTPSKREISSDLKDRVLDKKDLVESKSESSLDFTKNITLSKDENILEKTSELSNKSEELGLEEAEKDSFGLKTMIEKNGIDGLPSGYKLGVEDGDVVAKWDQNNREPRYPESAQLRGMQGKVLLKIQIDESGKVSSVFIEKGSGVPEINMAIEEIARTWKIYLAKNGLNIRGTVTLEYSFKLLGAN